MNHDLLNICIETYLALMLGRGYVVILDNLPTHNSAYAAEALKSAGARFLFLPSYAKEDSKLFSNALK